MNQNNDWNNFFQRLPEISWVAIMIGFFIGAVPGLALLAIKMMQESSRTPTSFEQFEQYKQERSQESYTPQTTSTYSRELRRTSSTQRRQRSSSTGRKLKNGIRKFPYRPIRTGKTAMILGGIFAAIFAMAGTSVLADWSYSLDHWNYILEDLVPVLMMFGGSLGAFFWGLFKNKRAKKFKQYLARMENDPLIPLRPIAESLPASMDEVCQTVQQMIDDGIFGDRAYIDIGSETLVIDASVAKPDPAQRPVKEAPKEDKLDFTAEDQILRDIRSANERIPGEEISRKIDRIEEITRHILTYLNKHPERAGELHTFLDYYLPTTLKMLNTYAELDAQRATGENIDATKRRIEGILDKVVEGFELQLDKLFEGDMLDISSDIDVMEKMLQRDGLSGDTRLRSRTFESKVQEGYTPSLTLDPNGGTATQTMPEDN